MTMSDLANGGFALVLALLTVGVATTFGLWIKDDTGRGGRRRAGRSGRRRKRRERLS
jgi:hypothetical protein